MHTWLDLSKIAMLSNKILKRCVSNALQEVNERMIKLDKFVNTKPVVT